MVWVVLAIAVGVPMAGVLLHLWLDWHDIVNDREERAHRLSMLREWRAAELERARESHAAERATLSDMDCGKK